MIANSVRVDYDHNTVGIELLGLKTINPQNKVHSLFSVNSHHGLGLNNIQPPPITRDPTRCATFQII